MKKLLTVCMMLAALSMIAFAGPKMETVDVLKYEPLNTMELKMAIQLLEEQIVATKNAGLEPDPAWNARLEELLLRLNPEERTDGNPLDQGGGACATATVIASAPYSDSGVLDGTDDRVGRPYFDVFYKYTAVAAGAHTADMCNSAGDTFLRIWTAGTCGTGASSFNDDGCGNSDPTLTLTYTVGQVLFYECGFYYSTGGSGSAYNFNLSTPTPPPANDQCAGALPMAVPGTTTGSTQFANHDYDSGVFGTGCTFTGSTAKDVVYTYTPSSNVLVTFDLCASSYDTKFYIATSCPPTAGTMVACDDDGCPGGTFRSILTCIPLTGGVTYYLFVDGYGTSSGAFSVTTSFCSVTGRCCYTNADGSPGCADGTLDECLILGGVFDNTKTCAEPCPSGQCCYTLPGDLCNPLCAAPVTPAYCATLGGVYTEGGDCSTPCPIDCYCTCSAGLNTHCALGSVAITDFNCPATPAEELINVPVEYHITDVNVCLDITHTWDGDISIYLISPLGTQVELSSGNGGGGDNYHCTILDDEATTLVTAGLAPFTGSYIPEFPLSGFDGENALGNWTLRVCDNAGGDTGTINWACLTFTYDYILPVTGVAFDAVAGNNSITLNWSTASESNMSHFEVLRGATKVAEVACTNSGTTHNYSFVDNDVTNGLVYSYTLVGVAIDGSRGELASVNASPNANAVVTEYALLQNFPNPFNPETNIAFDMVEAGHVNVAVYNVIGQKVAELVNGNMNAGRHVVSFDATNLPSGLYLYKMEANGFSDQKKMVLMK